MDVDEGLAGRGGVGVVGKGGEGGGGWGRASSHPVTKIVPGSTVGDRELRAYSTRYRKIGKCNGLLPRIPICLLIQIVN